ncbi:hypothetical protein, variant [Puccinia triticina 1-1 BBBD Race 1]|uniref:Tet-like 2OG-Fe(II) oxygenase domain-containing protein n=1 Tax=Puccinia triticina (isolate 1-1 / race 1 (BBBD)) TaxID=630390 RepID=A0A180GRQ1_PUCT1|nr:hypothetical protein PTTG_26632 [Puccinia triticina 1-1 BBBD Race 1]OAV95497.1 hypothetical protein, variant [Puccinia triticina 1-1 BBBD Race 1]
MKATSVPHSDSDDEPLIKRRTAQPLPLEPTQATLVDSDDEPLIKRRTAQPLPLEPTQATLVDSDNEPLIKRRTAQPLPLEPTQATLVDSDDEPLINRHPVAGKSSVRNIPAKKKRIRKKTSSMKAYQHRRSQQQRPGRRTKRKQHGISSTLTTNVINGTLCKTTRFPEPCNLFPEITSEYVQMKEDRQLARYLYECGKGPEPSKKTIYKQKPTAAEINFAYDYVNDPSFTLYHYGHIRVFDGTKNNQLIADIHFTNLSTLSESRRDELNFLCLFLHMAKKFVNAVNLPGRSCGGIMWAIGWRKAMAALEILGIYRNQKQQWASYTNRSVSVA